ncbi:hypothetical protein M0804_002118 [Polistes exclamans]|nr:hypothetical protein M0804_002118 [Polistes exclamans]
MQDAPSVGAPWAANYFSSQVGPIITVAWRWARGSSITSEIPKGKACGVLWGWVEREKLVLVVVFVKVVLKVVDSSSDFSRKCCSLLTRSNTRRWQEFSVKKPAADRSKAETRCLAVKQGEVPYNHHHHNHHHPITTNGEYKTSGYDFADVRQTLTLE